MFKSVPGCIEGIPGHYGMFRGIMGCSRGVPGLFRAVPDCSGGVTGMFRGVPGVFRVFRGVPGLFQILQTPELLGDVRTVNFYTYNFHYYEQQRNSSSTLLNTNLRVCNFNSNTLYVI